MDWFYPKRRGPEWKQGWTSQTLHSISTPPLPLLAILAIVVFLLSISQYTNYKSQLNNTMISFQVFLLLVPVLLIFFIRSGVASGRFNFWLPRPRQEVGYRTGASPWGVAVLVVVLLVLVSYQSSVHSKWFAPLRRYVGYIMAVDFCFEQESQVVNSVSEALMY
ncbi:hypothetical protein RJ639_021461 [Escallonia herrerae]|uniref:Uncharacterized protein n=1 Tax=Escallonia herrerae TaxID=1293975 RepID=A0AA88V4N4_9ASTE|nr:hypothetical protein RJ639_021461 [Escallonia herrerae]